MYMLIPRVRGAILLLTILVTAITGIGMKMMPLSVPVTSMRGDAEMPARGGHTPPGDQHEGSGDCLYCQLAKATDLPPAQGLVTPHGGRVVQSRTVHRASCHLRAWTLPCQPRAPPPLAV